MSAKTPAGKTIPQPLLERIETCLDPVPTIASAQTSAHPLAAVIIACLWREQRWQVLLTRRALTLKHHPGQTSFPGGRFEAGSDAGLAEAALRECEEETGLPSASLRVLGALTPQLTVSGFRVIPVVATGHYNGHFQPQPNEVDEILLIPLQRLLNDQCWRRENLKHAGISHTYWVSWWQQHLIWGTTAQIIASLRQRLRS